INEATAAGCFLNGFFFTGRDGQAAGFTLQLGSVYGIEQLYFEKWEGGNFRPADSISLPDDLEYTFRDPALQQGRNDYRVRVRLSNGLEFLSSVESVYYTEASRPVLFFPNPAPALAAPRVVVPESGRYTLRIMDLSGRQVYRLLLTQSVTHLPAGFLPKGVYIAWIHDASGKAFSEKLILY
ncbi:MAG TPA: T9SS type A sorting domain-containing protein, partial [Chitinophagaceae bacterium]|nr:T9SS type A sorting domain-containing protein [Chitinophagaceae bacterium]